jgi:hypothetical protein
MEWAVVVNRGRQDTTRPEPARWGDMGRRGAKAATAPAGGFGGGSGAGDGLNTAPLGVETSQPPFLTTPQHF